MMRFKMDTATRCPYCKEDALVSEGYDCHSNAAAQKVCASCGLVAAEGAFSQEDSSMSTTFCGGRGAPYNQSMPYRQTWQQGPRTPAGKTVGLNTIKDVSAVLGLTTVLTQQSVNLYDALYDVKKFHSCSLESKIGLSVGCVYVACRQADHAVTLYQMAPLADITPYDLGQYVRDILSEFSIFLKKPDITELVETYCGGKHGKFEPSVLEMSKHILSICKDVWIVEGRKPETLVMAACYLAWQADNFSARRKCTMKMFWKKNDLKGVTSTTFINRVHEMQTLLAQMAMEIPWVVGDVASNPKNVSEHIPDIIKFRNTLLFEAIARIKSEHKTNESSELKDVKQETSEDTEATAITSEEASTSEVNCSSLSDSCSVEERHASGTDGEVEKSSKADKRKCAAPSKSNDSQLLMLPPCLIGPKKKRKVHQVAVDDELRKTPDLSHLDNPTLSEKDISDTELKDYLLDSVDLKFMEHMRSIGQKKDV